MNSTKRLGDEIDIRAARTKNPKLKLGERFLLYFGIGGRYHHWIEGRYRTAMTIDKGLTWLGRGWLFLVVGGWGFGLAKPLVEIVDHLWKLTLTVGPWIALTLASGLIVLLFRNGRRAHIERNEAKRAR